MDPLNTSQVDLYAAGIELSKQFLMLNGIPLPTYWTYAQAQADEAFKQSRSGKLLAKLKEGPLQGTRTGYYHDNNLFVNIPVCAKPVRNPGAQNWSYPGYKVDRTPVGVVCHESAHHVDEFLEKSGLFSSRRVSEWVKLARGSKRITNYEPVPSEAFAETGRLFITNPDLLRLGSPLRYLYLTHVCHLKPLPLGEYAVVLNNHPAYIAQAAKWIAKKTN